MQGNRRVLRFSSFGPSVHSEHGHSEHGHSEHDRSEHGGVLSLFAIIISAVVLVAALAIDQGRGMLAHRNVEGAADALALAAAQALDGTQAGWRNAKRMTLIALHESDFFDVSDESRKAVSAFAHGPLNDTAFESDEAFQHQALAIDEKLVVSVDRGFYGATGTDDSLVFTSLEGKLESYGMPSYLVANAVRITVSLFDVETPLAKSSTLLAGNPTFDAYEQIRGVALAVRDQELDAPVAPIAIPACALLADMDPYSQGRYQTKKFEAPLQCGREIVAREPGALEGEGDIIALQASGLKQERLEGIARSETYARPALWRYSDEQSGANICFPESGVEGEHVNCKAVPIRAYLGAPGATDSQGALSAPDLRAAFEDARKGTLRARVGAPFLPVADDSYLDDLSLDQALRDFITSGRRFRDVFYSENGEEETNFPYRRNLVSIGAGYTDPFEELRVTWMGEEDGVPQEMSLLMAAAGDHGTGDEDSAFRDAETHLKFSNPMCHSEHLFHDNDLLATAKEVYVMVIGSADPTKSYCDMESLFTQQEQNAEPPRSVTKPIVLGYAKASVFDYNIKRLEHIPKFKPKGGMPELVDENPFAFDSQFSLPEFQEFLQDAERFAEDHYDYLACKSCESSGFPMPECESFEAVERGVESCPEETEAPIAPEQPDWIDECFATSTEILDLLALLEDMEPLDSGNLGIDDPGSGSCGLSGLYGLCKPSCKEFCGAERFEEMGTFTQIVDWEGEDRDCVDMMVNQIDPLGEVCGRDHGVGIEDVGCPADCVECIGGKGNLCRFEVAAPELPGGSCESLCSSLAGSAQFDECVALCETVLPPREGEDLDNYINELEELFERIQAALDNRYGDKEFDDADDLLDYLEDTDGANSEKRCLPMKVNDCYDLKDPACWDQPKDRDAGWGCGGVRLRLSCEDSLFMSGKDLGATRPVLVE